MLKIRLRRMGAKKAPFYRIVVADSRSPRDGAFVEEIGYYNPTSDPAELKVDNEKAAQWIRTAHSPPILYAVCLRSPALSSNNHG